MLGNWGTTALTAVAILVASLVHGIAGFGFAQVSMGILPLFRSPSSPSIVFTATAVVSNGRVWWSVREAFDWIEAMEYRPEKVVGASAGLFAGIFGGAVAVPDPPMIVYGAVMSASGFWSGEEMKAVFTAFFGTLMLYRLGSLTYTGAVTTPLLVEALVAIPMVFLGAWIGVYIFDHVPEDTFQWLVLPLLTVNAVGLLFTSVPEL